MFLKDRFYLVCMAQNFVKKHYRCKTCNTTHSIELEKNLLEGRTKYPFPHVILHSEVVDDELREFMMMLYLDKDLQIRGAEPLWGNEDFFTREQLIEITSNLMEEIERLREENVRLTIENNKLRRK